MMTQTGQVNSFKELGEHFLEFVQQSNDTTYPWEVIDDRLDEFYGATIKFPCKNSEAGSGVNDIDLSSIGGFNEFDFIEVSVVPPYDGGHHHYHRSIMEDNVHIGLSYFSLLAHKLGSSFWVSWGRHYYYDVDTSNNITVNCFNSWKSPSKVIIAAISFSQFIYLMEVEDSIISYYNKQIEAINDYIRNNNIDSVVIPFVIVVPLQLLGRKVNGEYDIELKQMMDDYVQRIEASNFSYCLYYPDESLYNIPYTSGLDASGHVDHTWQSNFEFDIVSVSSTYTLHGYGKGGITSGTLWDSIGYGSSYTMQGTVSEIITFSLTTGCSDWEARFDVSAAPLGALTFSRGFSIADTDKITNMKNPNNFNMSAYVSLQYNKITPTTYNEWLTNTKDHYMSETFNSNRQRPVWYSNSLVYERTTISNQRQNDIANIFKNTGEVLFISPHIKYDENLWMAEQGGIACDHETRNQSIEDNCLRAQHIRYPVSGGTPQLYWVKLPPFPSLGCPMFTIREDQLTASREIGEDAIQYYFVRTNTSASIVIYSRMSDSLNDRYGVQHMSFGALDCFSVSEQFMYPLYVAGGNGALDKEHWRYFLPTGGPPQHEVGNIYDLYMGNVSMSNSNLILSAKFNGSNTTNFRVLCPDGHWDNIFNVVQTCRLIVDPDECFPTPWTPRYYIYNEPVVGGSELGDNRFGGTTLEHGNNSIKKIDTHLIKRGYVSPPSTRMVTEDIIANSPVTPIVPVFSSHKTVSPEIWNRHRYGPIGKIPLCYSTWSRYLRFGELEINGKKFLAIPCTYEDKLWWLEARTSLDLATLDRQWEKIMNINNKLYNYIIYDYLLLQLEE